MDRDFSQFKTESTKPGLYETWPLPVMVIFGARFAHARAKAGLSQRALAYEAGVSQSVVSRLERGLVSHMSAERIIRLSMALGPSFPFGFCPHDHNCSWPYDPRPGVGSRASRSDLLVGDLQ